MDGIVIINKPKGCTSHDIVYKIKKIFNQKVGHTGTLDPNATGVLPILVGKGTALSQYLINHDKKYIATLKLGIKTDTADVEGNIIEEVSVDNNIFDNEKLENVLKSMLGKQKQKPPMYSAIKMNGKKLYEYARSGKNVDIPEREIEIYDLKLLHFDAENKSITFEVYCSKGTYVRTVCEKFAEKLGTIGYMQDLHRTMVGDFLIENSITIEELKENCENIDFLQNKFISIEKFFENAIQIKLNNKKLELFLNGVMIENNQNDGFARVYDENHKFIGIASIIQGKIKRTIVL